MEARGGRTYIGLGAALIGALLLGGYRGERPAPGPARHAQVSGAVPAALGPSRAARDARDDPVERCARTVVASLPDPEQAQLATYFDEGVEALDAAAQALGYIPVERSARGAQREAGLGALAYRDRTGAVLVIRLVGESPVLGADPAVLLDALEDAARESHCASEALRRANGVSSAGEDPEELRVLGPYFTGAAPGLWSALATLRKSRTDLDITVVTGSATGNIDPPAALAASFRRAVTHDQDMLRFLTDQLRAAAPQAAGEPKRIPFALLAESGTAYGADLSSGDAGLDVYHFPLHIAHVRTAHEHTDRRRDEPLLPTLQLKLDTQAEEGGVLLPRSSLTPFTAELALRSTLVEIARKQHRYLLIAATDVADTIFLAREAHLYCPSTRVITIGAHALYTHPDVQRELSGMLVASSYPLILENQRWAASGTTRSYGAFVNESQQGMYNALLTLLAAPPGDRARQATQTAHAPQALDLRPAWGGCDKTAPVPWLLEVYGGRFWPLRTERCDPERAQASLADAVPMGELAQALSLAVASANLVLAMLIVVTWTGLGRRIPGLRALASWSRALAPARAVYLGALACACAAVGLHVLQLPLHSTFSPSRSPLLLLAFDLAMVLGAACSAFLGGVGLGYVFYAPWLAFRDGPPPALQHGSASYSGRLWRALARWYGRIALLVYAAIAGWVALASWRSLAALCGELRAPSAPAMALRLADPAGLCPLMPVLLLGLGLAAWAGLGLGRVRMVSAFPSQGPFPPALNLPIATRINDCYIGRASPWADRLMAVELAVSSLCFVPCALFWRVWLPSFEWLHFDHLVKLGCTLLIAAVIVSTVQFAMLQHALGELTRRLVATPMVDAYKRIASKIAGSFGSRLISDVPKPEELGVSLRSAEALASMAERMIEAPGSDRVRGLIHLHAPGLRAAAVELDRALGYHLRNDAREHTAGDAQAPTTERPAPPSRILASDETLKAHDALFQASRRIWLLLEDIWKWRAGAAGSLAFEGLDSVRIATDEAFAHAPTASLLAVSSDTQVALFTRMAEDFVAMRNITFVYHVLRQIRYLMATALIGSVLTLVALFSYPFAPTKLLLVLTGALLMGVLTVVLRLIVRLERDELLSMISDGTPGAIDFNLGFVQQLVMYVALPALVLAVRIFPELAEAVGPWTKALSSVFQ